MYMFEKPALPDVFLCIYSGWWERGSGGLCLGRPNLYHRSCTYGGPLPVWWKCERVLCWWASLIVFIRLNLTMSVSILWSYSPLNWKKDNNWAPNQHKIISKWSCDTEDWRNGCWKLHKNKIHFKIYSISKTIILNLNNILKYLFYCIFSQINISMRLLSKILKIVLILNSHKNCIKLIFSKKQLSLYMWMYLYECEHLNVLNIFL